MPLWRYLEIIGTILAVVLLFFALERAHGQTIQRWKMRLVTFNVEHGYLIAKDVIEATTRDEAACKNHRDALVKDFAAKGMQVIASCKRIGNNV